jgi:hypothetical protein
MAGIFGILESSATQWYKDVAPTQELFFHRHIYSLWFSGGELQVVGKRESRHVEWHQCRLLTRWQSFRLRIYGLRKKVRSILLATSMLKSAISQLKRYIRGLPYQNRRQLTHLRLTLNDNSFFGRGFFPRTVFFLVTRSAGDILKEEVKTYRMAQRSPLNSSIFSFFSVHLLSMLVARRPQAALSHKPVCLFCFFFQTWFLIRSHILQIKIYTEIWQISVGLIYFLRMLPHWM